MADSTEQEPSLAAPVQSVLDVNVFVEYLRKVVPILLDDEDPQLRSFQAALNDKQNAETIKKFISDSQTPSLLFQRVAAKGEQLFICLFAFLNKLST